MKSFSNDIPNASTVVTQEDHDKFVSELTATLRSARNWIFGLAAANAILTIVLFIVHH